MVNINVSIEDFIKPGQSFRIKNVETGEWVVDCPNASLFEVVLWQNYLVAWRKIPGFPSFSIWR